MFKTPPARPLCTITVLLVVAVLSSFAVASNARSATWVQLNPATSPSARAVSAMAYDPVSKKVVMFGGFNDTTYLNDTWTWDGATWTQENTPVAPSPRTSAMMAYDFASRKLVLFGGFDGNEFLGDTWLWDGATSTWTLASPVFSPKPLAGAMLFTDPNNGKVDLYGGFDGRRYQLDTWHFLGNTWRRLYPASIPPARAWAVVGVDVARKIVILASGLGDVRTNTTWTWDGFDWTEQQPATALPNISDAAAAFDPAFRVVVVFGGDDGNGPLDTSWAWTGSNWLLGQTAQSPPARELHGMAYDFATGQLIVFGGTSGSFLNDTWSLVSQ